jgi:DNA-directed RNA polymerase I, II, and III subunit RPABC5
MLIPVRCFTCNKVLGQYWEPYMEELQKATNLSELENEKKTIVIGGDTILPKSIECKILDELGITRYCCRTIMMTTVDLIGDIV